MADQPTIGELRKAATVTDAQIDAATKAYLADPATGRFEVADGVTLDLAAAVKGHKHAADALADANATEAFKRGMIRTAIILARVEKA